MRIFLLIIVICCVSLPSFANEEQGIACSIPTNLSLASVDYTHAIITWNEVGDADKYFFSIRESNANTWTNAPVLENSVAVFLAPCTVYEYRVKSICGTDSSAYTSIQSFSSLGCSDEYCYSYSASSDEEWIGAISLNTLENVSGNNYGYGNFTQLNTTLSQGETYNLTLTPAFLQDSYAEYWRVWIDFNQNNSFEEANELVFDSQGYIENTITTNITIPSNILNGTTRMRVSMSGLDVPESCLPFFLGEVEDYTVTIEQAVITCNPLNITFTKENDVCNSSIGSIKATVLNGTPPFSYFWSTGATTQTIENLSVGNYTVNVTDANNCTGNKSTTIGNQVNTIFIGATVTQASCGQETGKITLNPSGGTAPYTYLWSHNSNLTNNVATNLPLGNYMVQVIDKNGCMASKSFTITDESNLLIQGITTEASCGESNGAINLTISGDVTFPLDFDWSHDNALNNPTANNLPVGVYTVVVTDANGCSNMASFSLNSTDDLTILAAITINATCGENNGEISLVMQNGVEPYTYAWSTGASTEAIEDLSPGEYSVVVKDAVNCSTSKLFEIQGIAPVEFTQIEVTPDVCNQNIGSISVEVTSGGNNPTYTYSWSHNANLNTPTINNLAAGLYTVEVRDNFDCVATQSIEVIDEDKISIIDLAITPVSCGNNDGAIDVTVEGSNLSFSWSHDESIAIPSLVGLAAGSYTITIENANDCILTETFLVEGNSTLTTTFSNTPASCGGNDGVVLANVTGGTPPYNFAWNTGATGNALVNIPVGIYELVITDATNCSTTETIIVESVNTFTGIDVNTIDASCNDNNGHASVTVTGGTPPYTYLWTNGVQNPVVNNLTPGEHTILITDANDCSISETVVIGNTIVPPQINIVNINTASCGLSNGEATIQVENGTPPYTYIWNSSLSLITPTEIKLTDLAAGNYQIGVVDNNECETYMTITIPSDPIPIAFTQSTPTICTENNGTATVVVSSGTPPYNFLWNTGETTSTINDLSTGLYQVIVTDASECSIMTSVQVETLLGYQLDLPDTVQITENEEVTLDATIDGIPVTYEWSTGATTPTISVTEAGIYSIIINSDNCEMTATIVVELSTGLSPTNNQLTIDVFPNPTKHYLNIRGIQGLPLDSNLKVMDITGRVINIDYTRQENNQLQLDVSNYLSGIYYIFIEIKNNMVMKKFIKE